MSLAAVSVRPTMHRRDMRSLRIAHRQTFSKDFAYLRGKAMGTEHRLKGVNIQLGPVLNVARVPAGGRNWESGSADPWHLGAMGAATIRGIQSAGVQANAKHFVGNQQETLRNTYSDNIDGRTSREIYEHPFLKAVQADVATFMCAVSIQRSSSFHSYDADFFVLRASPVQPCQWQLGLSERRATQQATQDRHGLQGCRHV